MMSLFIVLAMETQNRREAVALEAKEHDALAVKGKEHDALAMEA